jgi:molybdenum cofactor cytidylyltransferase
MITAIILAAGASKRMGRPKMLLPWGEETVLSHVVSTFFEAGLKDILVVTGGAREQVESAISHLEVRTIYNREFAKGEMLSSIQCGINTTSRQAQAVLIGLGDQPQVQTGSVRMVCDVYHDLKSDIVIPSFKKRRGHPWLVSRPLWSELLNMDVSLSSRSFLNTHSDKIHYVDVDDPGVLADMDTPEDYQRWRP